MIQSGQTIVRTFTVEGATGAAANADALPTGTLYLNGAADAAVVTVTNLATGVYKFSVTVPALAVGDAVEVVVAATAGGVVMKSPVWGDSRDAAVDAAGAVTVGGYANDQSPEERILAVAAAGGETGTIQDAIYRAFVASVGMSEDGVSLGVVQADQLSAIKERTDNLPDAPAATGDAMALTVGERDLVAAVVESHLLDEGDSQMLVNAIVGAIGNQNVDQAVLVAAVRADLERVGGYLRLIDAKTTNLPASPANTADVLSRLATAAYVAPDNAGIAAAAAGVAAIPAFPARFSTMRIDQDGVVESDPFVLEFSVAGNTMTVKRLDGVTAKYTRTLATDAGALPVVGSEA
jgi:hypothetical protein